MPNAARSGPASRSARASSFPAIPFSRPAVKHITFYLDFVSPYAWLAFEQLPQAWKD